MKTKFNFKTIKSFEDACKKEGIDPTKLPDVSMIPEEFRGAIIAVYRLFIIYKAINNGWVADYTNNNQYKYYPWFKINSSGSGFVFSFSFSFSLTRLRLSVRAFAQIHPKKRFILVSNSVLNTRNIF
jgi:hypothetical protein